MAGLQHTQEQEMNMCPDGDPEEQRPRGERVKRVPDRPRSPQKAKESFERAVEGTRSSGLPTGKHPPNIHLTL